MHPKHTHAHMQVKGRVFVISMDDFLRVWKMHNIAHKDNTEMHNWVFNNCEGNIKDVTAVCLDWFVKRSCGNTPLMLSLKLGCFEKCRQIIKYAQDHSFEMLMTKDNYNVMPRTLACALCQMNLVRLMDEVAQSFNPQHQADYRDALALQHPGSIHHPQGVLPPLELSHTMIYHEMPHDDATDPAQRHLELVLLPDEYHTMLHNPLYIDERVLPLSHNYMCHFSGNMMAYYPGAWVLSSVLIFHLGRFMFNIGKIPASVLKTVTDALSTSNSDTQSRAIAMEYLRHAFVEWRQSEKDAVRGQIDTQTSETSWNSISKLSSNATMDQLNTFCQRQGIRPIWTYQKCGGQHECKHRASLTVASCTMHGEWSTTKSDSKRSAAIMFLNTNEVHAPEVEVAPVKVLILTDVDNSLDILSRLYTKHPHAHCVSFCGRSFHCRSMPPNCEVYRSLSYVKNAAEMAMSFHSFRIVEDYMNVHNISELLVVSRDAALAELVAQLRHSFPSLKVELVSF